MSDASDRSGDELDTAPGRTSLGPLIADFDDTVDQMLEELMARL